MSAVLIRSLLEATLASMTPTLSTAWENHPFEPVVDTPYQRVHLLLADPASLEMSQRVHREQGFLQVTLCYPLGAGSAAASQRAEAIRSTFYGGRTFTSGDLTVAIDGTPSISPGIPEDDHYVLPIRIRFYAHVTRSA